jgi:predicted RNA-binding protein YlqC (UPF0109 family)
LERSKRIYRKKEMNSTPDKDFLEYIVKALVDHPEDVKIDRKIDERGVLLVLHVNPMDMGQVVGRKGATAKAIRSLLRIVGIKNNAYVNLKIEEPQGGFVKRQLASQQRQSQQNQQPEQTSE